MKYSTGKEVFFVLDHHTKKNESYGAPAGTSLLQVIIMLEHEQVIVDIKVIPAG